MMEIHNIKISPYFLGVMRFFQSYIQPNLKNANLEKSV